MSNELSYPGWREFARQNNLTFNSYNSWLLGNPYVTGNYGGYNVRLEDDASHTRMSLEVDKSVPVISAPLKKLIPTQKFDTEQMIQLFMPPNSPQLTKGRFFAYENGRKLVYERDNIIEDAKYLQLVLDTLKEVIEVYPQMVEFGGEVVTGLLPLAKRFNPFQHVAAQLLAEIGKVTEKRLKRRKSDLICSFCLVHCGAHQIATPWTNSITYYGCKVCGQSREFISAKNYRLIMVLDNTTITERSQHNGTIRVNWMKSRQLFDFDEVEIVQATDEEVEHFAVQVGNDTDPTRHQHYKQMRCTVRLNRLSENTLRILQYTFGSVEEKAA